MEQLVNDFYSLCLHFVFSKKFLAKHVEIICESAHKFLNLYVQILCGSLMRLAFYINGVNNAKKLMQHMKE